MITHIAGIQGIFWDISPSGLLFTAKGQGYMFTGELEHTLDDKGRVSLPSRHRDELGAVVMIGRGTGGQVHVLPMSLWTNLYTQAQQAIQDQSELDETVQLLLSYNEAEIDRQGRIVIPVALRRHAALGTDVTIVGQGDHVEIWSRDAWQNRWDSVVTAKRTPKNNSEEPKKASTPMFHL